MSKCKLSLVFHGMFSSYLSFQVFPVLFFHALNGQLGTPLLELILESFLDALTCTQCNNSFLAVN